MRIVIPVVLAAAMLWFVFGLTGQAQAQAQQCGFVETFDSGRGLWSGLDGSFTGGGVLLQNGGGIPGQPGTAVWLTADSFAELSGFPGWSMEFSGGGVLTVSADVYVSGGYVNVLISPGGGITTTSSSWVTVVATVTDPFTVLELDFIHNGPMGSAGYVDNVEVEFPCGWLVSNATPTPTATATPPPGLLTPIPTPTAVPSITIMGTRVALPGPLQYSDTLTVSLDMSSFWDFGNLSSLVSTVRTVPVMLNRYSILRLLAALVAALFALNWVVGFVAKRINANDD